MEEIDQNKQRQCFGGCELDKNTICFWFKKKTYELIVMPLNKLSKLKLKQYYEMI